MSENILEEGPVTVTRFCGPDHLKPTRICYQINAGENAACPCNIVYIAVTMAQAEKIARAILKDVRYWKPLEKARRNKAKAKS